ncbi:MAG: hypothetical protein J2P25_09755 [Nocardiopsaceae bacterium]|nr:hypothetical protein [Nocardiopsaceae bacterium]
MPTTSPWRVEPYSYPRRSWRKPLIVMTVVIVVLVIAGYAGYNTYQHFVTRVLTVPGCQAGSGSGAIGLDFEQARDAATIADVAVYDHLPRQALTIAYATALQEAKLENPNYGTSDSVGIFQQRPSAGWGTAQELQDPVYASQAFFESGPSALTKIPDYTSLSVAEAAQEVQHSADGSAYAQWTDEAEMLSADYMSTPHAVTCWYDPSQAARQGGSTKPDLPGAVRTLEGTFGTPRADGIVTGVTSARSGKSEIFEVTSAGRWAVANWLVTNASSFGITRVAYGGYQWTASLTETHWQQVAGNASGNIVVS